MGSLSSLAPAKQFEWLFRGGVGVLVCTSIGSLGAPGVPGPEKQERPGQATAPTVTKNGTVSRRS